MNGGEGGESKFIVRKSTLLYATLIASHQHRFPRPHPPISENPRRELCLCVKTFPSFPYHFYLLVEWSIRAL